MSDFALPASSASLALFVRSRGRPLDGGDWEEPTLSERAKPTAGVGRACAGVTFVEFEPTGEELLANLWSKAFNAIAL